MQEDGAFTHFRQRGDGGVRVVVGELGVNLVGDDEQVVLAADRGDLLQFRTGHDAAGGIAREVHQQHFGPRRDRGTKRVGTQLELVFLTRADRHGLAMRERNARAVGDVARLVIKHLVAGIDHRAQRKIEAFGNAHRDENLRRRIVSQAVIGRDVLRDRFPQLHQAEIGRVAGLAAFERVDRRFADMPRGDEVGLADAERNDALHRLHDLEEVTDARARDIAHVVRHEIGRRLNGGKGKMHVFRRSAFHGRFLRVRG